MNAESIVKTKHEKKFSHSKFYQELFFKQDYQKKNEAKMTVFKVSSGHKRGQEK